MPGITNEHDLTPLPRELSAALVAGHRLAPIQSHIRPTARARVKAVRRMLDGVSGLGWSVIGFVLGAVFWHFVGFWGFVANVVVAGPVAPSTQTMSMDPRGQLMTVAEASTTVSPAACTVLFLDRSTGLTSSRLCEGDQPELRADIFQGREDRLIGSPTSDEASSPARHSEP